MNELNRSSSYLGLSREHALNTVGNNGCPIFEIEDKAVVKMFQELVMQVQTLTMSVESLLNHAEGKETE